jgi:L-ascorbate metabolism protein UlaG (beta-lactamase superfamily)
MTDRLFLRQNAFVEPLYNDWYAWPYLVSPMTAPMFVGNLHLRLMESFVATPQVHVAALRNPEMAGGPFLSFEESRATAVASLVQKTRRRSENLLEFADAVRDLTAILTRRADGTSLRPLYAEVPEALRGFVELVYDVNGQPSIRFLESLLYRSRFFDESLQSLDLSVVQRDDRPFVFSTPRLEEDDRLRVSLPYRAEGLDRVFRMREAPQPLAYAKEALGLGSSGDARLEALFTNQPPRDAEPYVGPGVRVRYFGHACVLLESGGTTVLTDPVVAYDHGRGLERFSFADLPQRIDFVLITHSHQDHCMLETLLQLRHKVGHVVVPKNSGGHLADPSLKLVLESAGFSNVYEIDELGVIKTADGAITSLPFLGEHGDLNIRSKTTYLVRLLGRSFLFCADSNAFEPRLYDHLASVVGPLDAAFVGMECDGAPMSWLYGPVLTAPIARRMDQSRRLDASDCERAMELVRRMRPRAVYVYAMGSEPWLTYLTSIHYTDESRPMVEARKLVQECQAQGVCAEMLFGKKQLELGA